MRIRDLSLRVKVAVTLLGALAVGLGLATTFSLRFWESEQLALTTEHALMVAGSERAFIEAELAHGRLGEARRRLNEIAAHSPVVVSRVVSRDGIVLMSSRPEEEMLRRPGTPLPYVWDIPSQGQVVGEPGSPELGVIVPLAGATGLGSRAVLELVVGGSRIERSIQRARTFGLTVTLVLGIAYAVLVGAMMEREVIGPFRKLERLARDQQEQLTQRAGFAEVGALASEVAHEIKRPLAGIRGAIEMIAHEYTMNDSERRLLTQVEQELSHVDETLRDLLSLARPVGLERRPVPIGQTCDAALVRLSGVPGAERVKIARDYARDLPPVPGDASRLEQAVLNLCVNAVEAMPDGGSLSVSARRVNGGVEIAVRDSGSGIPPENLDRIAKPFFSTKEHGTGLGLPLVARVMAAHGGRMDVASEPGKGSEFRLFLPTEQG